MRLTYLGHSCFLLNVGGKNIILDPFIRPNALAQDAGVDIDTIQADYILVSHGHEDHTADLVYLASKTGAKVVCSWEISTWLQEQGLSNIHPMNIGGSKLFDFGKVKMVFAAHSSSLADGTYAGLASGFIIQSGEKTIYYAGDTALNQEMKLIAEFNKIDWAILPVGDNFTMDYVDACRAADFLNCRNVVAMHFDTFGFIQIDHQKVATHFSEHGKNLIIPSINSFVDL
jgi:L-ascorbate metabolism protein UlaG (beta-lactamase superfamily)